MSSSGLNYVPILEAWLKGRPSLHGEVLMPLFEQTFVETSIFVAQNLFPKMEVMLCHFSPYLFSFYELKVYDF